VDDKQLEEMAQMPKDDYLTPSPEEPSSSGDATDDDAEADPGTDAEADAPSTYGAP
jgi:hypothetical protein